MATHSSILTWRILWTEEPGGLQSMGSQRVGCDWSDWARTHSRLWILEGHKHLVHTTEIVPRLRIYALWKFPFLLPTRVWAPGSNLISCSDELGGTEELLKTSRPYREVCILQNPTPEQEATLGACLRYSIQVRQRARSERITWNIRILTSPPYMVPTLCSTLRP